MKKFQEVMASLPIFINFFELSVTQRLRILSSKGGKSRIHEQLAFEWSHF